MSNNDTIKARSIELTNEAGEICAVLGLFNGNPGLHLYDKNQILRIAIGINDYSVSGITLHDGQGVPVANICSYHNGISLIQFSNSGESFNLALSIDNYKEIGEPRLVLCDSQGRVQFSTSTNDTIGDHIEIGTAVPVQEFCVPPTTEKTD